MTATKKASPIVVRGTKVDNALIAAYTKRVNSFDSIVTIWANAAALQATKGNKNWLDSLFALPVMRLANGNLNATGKSVLAYTAAHFPRVTFDSESQKVVLKKFNAASPLAANFVAVGVDANDDTQKLALLDKGVGFEVVKDVVYVPHGDFILTYTEFLNLEKAEKEVEEKPKTVTAKSIISSAEKAVAALNESRFAGSAEENAKAVESIKALFLKLSELVSADAAVKVADGEKQVDVAKAAELLASGQKGKSARASSKAVAEKAAA